MMGSEALGNAWRRLTRERDAPLARAVVMYSFVSSSIVAAPYADAKGKVVGVIGVIGPTRLNYARIIPMVDYTARVVGRLLA